MGRPRKRVATEEKASSNQFLDALKFLSLITKDIGEVNQTHVCLFNHCAVASNGVLSAGHKITEDIYACPQNRLMIEALSKCGDYLSLTQLDNNRLSVKSAKFKAIVPCIDQTLLAPTFPDEPVAIVDDKLKLAFEAMQGMPAEGGNRVEIETVLMNGCSLVGTNGRMLFEYWHGIDLPPSLAIPKAIIAPIIKTSKKLIKFGYSMSSVTFWFEDDSWLKSQLFATEWPGIKGVLDKPINAFQVPSEFWAGVGAVSPFSETGLLYFGNEIIRSHDTDAIGASYDVPGLPKGPVFSAKQLILIKPYAQTIDFLADAGRMLIFHGQNIRGGIMGYK